MLTLAMNDFWILENDLVVFSVQKRFFSIGRLPEPLHAASSSIRSNDAGENGGPSVTGLQSSPTIFVESAAKTCTHLFIPSFEQLSVMCLIFDFLSKAIRMP